MRSPADRSPLSLTRTNGARQSGLSRPRERIFAFPVPFPFQRCRSSNLRLRSRSKRQTAMTLLPNSQAVSQSEPQDGESRAHVIERLFRDHNEALLRFLRGRVRSHSEALEVAQEAYVRLLSLDQPGAVSYLRAFLFKTAANIAIDRRRRHLNYGKVTERQLFMELAENRTPEREVAAEQTLHLLERLIEAMPPKCRESFVMNQ